MRKLLVAMDGSDPALRALDFAIREAQASPGGRVHVLVVQPPVRVYGEIDVYVGGEHMREIAAAETRAILEVATGRAAGAECTVIFEQAEGDPAGAVVRRAAELGCDGIVMGTHGRGRLASAMMGSVAQRVVHLAELPVTLLR
jgi:nucleotide-binding universal stress UspA family protein